MWQPMVAREAEFKPQQNVRDGPPAGIRVRDDHGLDRSNRSVIASIPVFSEFEGVADAANYRPLPDDWALATTDIVGSTNAIASGQYKAVNMAARA